MTDAAQVVPFQKLEPDRDQIARFVQTLFALADKDTYVYVLAFHDAQGLSRPWKK